MRKVKKAPSYHIINMASYTSPSIVEQNNKDWVEYGEDNNYFQYLIDLYYGSPTNNACIKGKADLVYGNGPEIVKADRHLKGYLDFKIIFGDEQVKKCVMDLVMLGMCAFQLVKSKDGKKYVKAYHFPIQTLRPQKANDKGEVEKWYYCPDWSKMKKGYKPQEFAAFGYDDSAKECMYVIRPYSTGNYYFSPPDYQGGTQYCELEGEISNYHLNNIKNGLAPSMLINFNNGEPPEETKDAIEAQINAKFGGSSRSGTAIIAFNDGKENAADITPVALSDAHNQYQFLSTECVDKILLAHRITSPLIFGVKNSGSGFSSNADELKTGLNVFENIVIRPFQQLLISAFNEVLLFNGYMVDIYFKSLNPLDVVEYGVDTPKKVAMSKIEDTKIEMSNEDEEHWISHLSSVGEKIDLDEWELVDVQQVTDDEPYKFAYDNPSLKSKDDKGIFKIRYRYGPHVTSDNSRKFCKEMVSMSKSNVVFRREDIDIMSFNGVNGQFAPEGSSNYSIWKFKGGVYCHHQWERVTFRRKYQEGKGGKVLPLTPSEKNSDKRDMKNYTPVSNDSADNEGVPFNPPSWDTASTKTIDLPNRGSLKNK
jgi:hypothetical protein